VSRKRAATEVCLVTAHGTGLAGKHVCARTDGRTLNKAAACDRCSARTNSTAAEGLLADCVTAGCEARTCCDNEGDVLDGHREFPFDVFSDDVELCDPTPLQIKCSTNVAHSPRCDEAGGAYPL
jgi:hypothetical protein